MLSGEMAKICAFLAVLSIIEIIFQKSIHKYEKTYRYLSKKDCHIVIVVIISEKAEALVTTE